MKEKISTLARKVAGLEGKRLHEVQVVTENPTQSNPCINCQSTVHLEEHCPIAPSVRDFMLEHANAVGQWKPQPNAPYGNTYNSNWKNHPNLSWKPKSPCLCASRCQTTVWFLISTTAITILFPCGTSYIKFEQGGRQFCGGEKGDQCTIGSNN